MKQFLRALGFSIWAPGSAGSVRICHVDGVVNRTVVGCTGGVLSCSLVACFLLGSSPLGGSIGQAQPPVSSLPAAQPQSAKPAEKKAEAPETMQVIIQRDAVQLMDPSEFQAPISLSPVRLLEVRSQIEGIVRTIRVKPGAVVKSQEELVLIDSTYAKKVLERAQANLKAANLRKEVISGEVTSGKQPQIALELADAEIQVAKSDLDLAQYDLDNTSVRAAFSGQVQLVSTTPGTFVNKRDLLLTLSDPSQLSAQIPVDREKVKQGDMIEIQLDNKVAKGKVQAILPLKGDWLALRRIVDTAALAVVVIENQNGDYKDGQTVYSSIVPRSFVIEVPNVALKNSETGSRIIQVVRDQMVREIEVQLLGPDGEGRSYVSGPLLENDELITESSHALADGTLIRPATITRNEEKASGAGGKKNSTEKPGGSPVF